MSLIMILLVLVAGAGMAWYWTQQQKPKRPAVRLADKPAQNHRPGGIDKLRDNDLFWGVELCQAGCEPARALLGTQYPFDAVPELPLPGCDSATCTCQFKGLTDKRSNIRRTHADRRKDIRFDKDHPERRSKKNRRRNDSWNNHSY